MDITIYDRPSIFMAFYQIYHTWVTAIHFYDAWYFFQDFYNVIHFTIRKSFQCYQSVNQVNELLTMSGQWIRSV